MLTKTALRNFMARNRLVLVLILPLLFPLWGQDKPFIMFTAIMALLTTGFAMTLRLKLSAYLLDIGHLAWVGIAAYLSSVFVMRLGIPFWANLFLVPVIIGILSALIAIPATRTVAVYLAIVTISLGEMVRLFFSNVWRGVFGGIGGIWDIPGPEALGPFTFTKQDHTTFFYLALALVVIIFIMLRRIERIGPGMVFRSIRENATLGESVGLWLRKEKVLCFALASALVAPLGVFAAHYIHVITPADFGVAGSFALFIYIVVGGRGHILGPALGVILFVIVTEVLRTQGVDEYQPFFMGGALIIFLLFIPDGVVGFIMRQWAKLTGGRARRGKALVAEAAPAPSSNPAKRA